MYQRIILYQQNVSDSFLRSRRIGPKSMFLSATFMVQKAAFLRGSCNKNENYSRDGDSVQQDSRLRNAKMNAFWPECFFAVSKALLSFCCKSNGFENFHLLVAESVTESFTATICNEKKTKQLSLF